MREAYEIIEEAMIINWCVVLRVQCTLGSTSFFALWFLSLQAQVTSVVLFNDDDPFIVLTETKSSYRHIPVWARYSPHRTRVEAHVNTLSP